MLDDRFEVETSQTVTDADLYLIEDHLFPEYRAALRDRVAQEDPAFCPVVLIQRESTDLTQGNKDPSAHESGVPYDEVVDAPINPAQLRRRLHSLLVRRQQSRQLMQQVSTLEEREQRLRRFEQGIESTGNGVIMTDPEGSIEYVNSAFESIAGYAEDEVLGESPQILLPEGTGEVFDEKFWQTLADQTEWEGDIVIERMDSHRQVVNATATTLRDAENETEGFVIVLSDITERIQREQDLEDSEEELDLLRQILLRYLRHNLRNDLNVIQGNAELLKEDETLSQKQSKSVEAIIDNSEDLIEMSDKARTYSSLLGRDTELSTFDLSKVTTEVVQRVREDHSDVTFELDVPESCEIRARDGIQRAFEELIDNAARHNDATDPWVRIEVRDREGPRVVIEDNGPGISEQELESLERGTETQLSHSQGVGLWLSKWQIEGVDGQLSIAPIDSGTRVTVAFPPPATVGSTGLEVATLKEREERLQTITDRMTDAIIKVDAEWTVTLLDERAEEMLDVNADTVVGHRLWDVFSDLQDTQFDTVVRNTMESRSATQFEEYVAELDAWLEVNVYPEFDGGLSFYTRDITERKEREQELAEQRADLRLFERAVEGSTDLIGAVDTEYNLIFANERHREFHGVNEDDIVGQPVAEVIGAPWESEVKPRVDRALAGEVIKFDMERTGDDGEVRSFDLRFYPLPGEDGTTVGVVGTMRDITERKEQERKREQIIDRVTDAIVEVDADWQFTLVNEQAEELYDMSEELLLGRDFWEVFEDAKGTRFEEEYRHVMETREPTSFTEYFSQLDGWFDITVYPRNDGGLVFYFVEVTEQKEREQRYNAIFNQTYQFTGLLEPDGTLIEANDTALAFGGLDRDEVIGKKMWNAYWFQHSEETRARAKAAVQRAADGEFVRHELPVQGANGDVTIDFSVRPITNEQGKVTLLIPEGRDITDLKEREQELQNRTKQLQDIIDSVDAAVWIRNNDGEYEYMNQYHRDQFDIADDVEIVGKQFKDLLPVAVAEQFRENDQRVYDTEEPVAVEETVETEDGPKDFFTRINPLFDNGSVYATCGIASDITDRKARERQLEQFAGVVSHDLRNPLSLIEGRLELAREDCDSDHLEQMGTAVDRMNRIINDLLWLAREGKEIGTTEPVDLQEAAETAWEIVVDSSDNLEFDGGADEDRTIAADEDRFAQLLENIFRNSLEHGGENVTTSVGILEDGFYIEDDGRGIPKDELDDVFEAGYSTSNDGTGFGLSIVKQVVEAHDWEIHASEGAEGGARFEITGVEFVGE